MPASVETRLITWEMGLLAHPHTYNSGKIRGRRTHLLVDTFVLQRAQSGYDDVSCQLARPAPNVTECLSQRARGATLAQHAPRTHTHVPETVQLLLRKTTETRPRTKRQKSRPYLVGRKVFLQRVVDHPQVLLGSLGS